MTVLSFCLLLFCSSCWRVAYQSSCSGLNRFHADVSDVITDLHQQKKVFLAESFASMRSQAVSLRFAICREKPGKRWDNCALRQQVHVFKQAMADIDHTLHGCTTFPQASMSAHSKIKRQPSVVESKLYCTYWRRLLRIYQRLRTI